MLNRMSRWATGAFLFLACVSLIAMASREAYWRWWQDRPRVVTGLKPDGTPDLPVMTTGLNKDGLTLDNWVKRGEPNAAWRPVEQTSFSKAKGSFAVLFHNCYYFKTAARVVRSFVGAHGGATIPLGERVPPTATIGCARRVFFETIPSHVPPGDYRYRVVIHYYQNERYPDVEAPLPEVPITITE